MRTINISLTEELSESMKRFHTKEEYLKACYIESDKGELLNAELDEWDQIS